MVIFIFIAQIRYQNTWFLSLGRILAHKDKDDKVEDFFPEFKELKQILFYLENKLEYWAKRHIDKQNVLFIEEYYQETN